MHSGQSAIITFPTHTLLTVCHGIIAPKDDVDSYGFLVHYVGKIAHLSKRHPNGLRHVSGAGTSGWSEGHKLNMQAADGRGFHCQDVCSGSVALHVPRSV